MEEMAQKLIAYFAAIIPLTQEEEQAVAATMNIQHYKKGRVLLSEGQISDEAYFVLDGCVRQYYLVNGEEKTSNFFTETQWVVSMHSFTQRAPSTHYLECCVDCTLIVGNRELEEDLYRRFPKLETISRMVMQKVFAEQQEIAASYITDTPEQRYRKLLQQRPYLIQMLPQYQLASYIGVKPESLSRIRKRMSTQNG